MVYFHNDLITGQLLVSYLESERRVFCPIAMILLDQSLGASAQLATNSQDIQNLTIGAIKNSASSKSSNIFRSRTLSKGAGMAVVLS